MYCALTGETVNVPVVSPQGILFDKESITKHIKQYGTCPITEVPLKIEELIPMKLSNPEAVLPRQLTGDSVPMLVKNFQTEYDAMVFENFSIRKQLESIRKELAQTLYQNDAACRVIARLLKDRDTALSDIEQLKKTYEKAGPKVEHIEPLIQLPGLDTDSKNKITQRSQELSAQRKQRVVSPSLTPIDVIKEFNRLGSFPIHQAARPGILCLDIHPLHEEITVSGGVDKTAVIFDVHTGKKLATLAGHKKQVTSVLFHPTEETVITASTDTQIWIWGATSPYRTSYKPVHQLTTHTGEVVQCSMHSIGEYLASASRDGTWAFHSLAKGQTLIQVPSPNRTPLTSIMIHPDGIILATGNDNNEIQIWDIRSQKKVANFDGHTDAITDVCFSENGFYLASTAKDSNLKLWDLRGPKNIKTVKMDAFVKKLHYDYSGKYLAVATGTEIRIFTGQQLEHAHTLAEHTSDVTDVKFGKDAAFLVSSSMDRTVKLWGK